MTKSKISVISIAIVMLLGIISCERDLDSRHFPINVINDITILGFKSGDGEIRKGVPGTRDWPSFEVALGSVFVLDAILEFGLGEDHSTYTFGWYEIDPNPDTEVGSGRLLSEERTLSLHIDADFSNLLRPYRMKFRITDMNTGVSYQRAFLMTVRNPLQIGWYALTERANGFEIDVIGLFMGEIRLYNSVLDMMDSPLPREGERPLSIFTFPNWNAPTMTNRDLTNFSIMIQTDVATRMVRSADFSWEPPFNISAFVALNHPVLTPGFKPNRFIPMIGATTGLQTRLYMHHDDDFYIFNRVGVLLPFWEPVNIMRDTGTQFRVAPFIAGNLAHGVVMFDLDNKRFVRHAILTTSLLANTPSDQFLMSWLLTDVADAPFSFNTGIESLLYMDTFTNNQGFAVIRNTSGNYQLFRFTKNATGAIANAANTFDSDLVASVEHFAMHPGGVFLYMATADRVWRVATAMNPMTTVDITDQLGLPQGYRISTFDFLPTNGGGQNFQNFLTVGSYNPSGAAGENGRLDMFDVHTGLAATGDLTLRSHEQPNGEETPMSFTGIGRPVSVAYRMR